MVVNGINEELTNKEVASEIPETSEISEPVTGRTIVELSDEYDARTWFGGA